MSVVWSLNYFVFMLFDYILPLIGLNERWQTVRNRIEAGFFFIYFIKTYMYDAVVWNCCVCKYMSINRFETLAITSRRLLKYLYWNMNIQLLVYPIT